MKALLTAGGRATRLRPITWTVNKHLVPLAGKPMLQHAIEKLVDAGVTEIVINLNPGDREIREAFGDGSRYGAKLTYFEQEGGPLGVAHVIRCAEPYIGNEPFIFYLGDNIILGSLRRFIDKFNEEKCDALLALSRVPDPQRFGVPIIENGRIVRVLEKPKDPPSDYAVTGIYLYTPRMFDAVKSIPPSPRGEFEISDAHTWLIEQGAKVGYEEITGWWKDTGTPKDLLEGNALLLNERQPWSVRVEGEVKPGAVLRGQVSVGKNTIIGPNVVVRGPVCIGENARLDNCYIGPYTTVGNFVRIDGPDIENTMIHDGATVVAKEKFVDSILGKNTVIEAQKSLLPTGHRIIIGDNGRVDL